jgi:hypothetical protein
MAKKDVPYNQQYNWRNFWICFLVSLGQIAFGYPSSIIGTTLVSSIEYNPIVDMTVL